MRYTRPVWAEIDLDHLAHNMREVRRVTAPEALVTAVIKADGYGHGASTIAETLLKNGADRFAVATLTEAIRLRRVAAQTDILILGYTPSSDAPLLIKHQLTATVYSYEQAKALHEYAKTRHRRIKVHLKIDTGMSRLGFLCTPQAVQEILGCYSLSHLEIEGVYTHFAKSDERDKTTTLQQVERYLALIGKITAAGYAIPIKHVSNSAAIIDLPEYNFDMVRAGIMLYGLYPSNEVNKQAVDLKQVMSLRARLSHVKTVPAGTGISYGHVFHAAKQTVIGSLPIGYADGFSRMLTGKTDVLYRGKRYPVVGRICMDQCMIDLAGQKARRGEVVTLFGEDGTAFKSIDEVAQQMGTINYEIVCMLDKRVPRHYIANGELVSIKDNIMQLADGD